MTTRKPVKGGSRRRNQMKAGRQLLVGVIASAADLRFALAMKQPPDLFELRLDCLGPVVDRLERKMSILSAKGRTRRGEKAPIIITARDPREGGAGNLSFEQRHELLSRFLPHAKYVDLELRSARAFKSLLDRARKQKVGVILSFHHFKSTPSPRSLRAKALVAKKHGADVFKIATRTEKPSELARLVNFITAGCSGGRVGRMRLAVMGIGKLGGLSRLLFARCGSVLNYSSLQQSFLEGQLPIHILRSALRR